jgi:4-hydroxybenzoate polyprenyltransferase
MAKNFTSAPKNVTWWIALILGVLGLLGFLGVVAPLSTYAFWLVLVGLVLLLVACITRNL